MNTKSILRLIGALAILVGGMFPPALYAQSYPSPHFFSMQVDSTATLPNVAITGGTITGLSAPIPLGSGGTGSSTAIGATSSLQYLQGGTGSVARTLTNKFQDSVSVKDFGVQCNNTDESVGIQAAINAVAVTGGSVYFPQTSGSSKCSFATGLTVPDAVRLYGEGKYATILLYTGTGSAISAAGSGNNHVAIENLTLQLTGANAKGIDATRFISSTFRSLHLVNQASTGQTGIYVNPTATSSNPFFNVVDDVTFDGALANGMYLTLTAPAINGANRWRILAPTCLSTVNCLNLDNVQGSQVIAPYCDQQSGTCVIIGAASQRIQVIAPTQETAAGGTMFGINAAANRVDIIAPKIFAGLYGTATLGTRGTLVGDWDTGIQFSGSTTATPVSTYTVGDNLGVVESGIKSLSLNTPLGVASGGTGATTATGAIGNLFAPTTVPILGCDTTGNTDATACVQSRINTLTGAGRVKITGKLLIGSNLTIPAGVTLDGDCTMPGTIGSNSSTPYGNLTCGVLMVASTATVSLSAGSGIKSAVVYRSGMTFPAADASAFAGTAITAAGDDVSLDHVLVMGFNKAFYSSGFQRARIEYLYHDNVNGVEITNASDVPYISHSHAWPFATIATFAATSNYSVLERSGIAYNIHDIVDWAKLTDDFSYGYAVGFQVSNADETTLLSCGADDTFSAGLPHNTGSKGFNIIGTSNDTRLIAPQASAHDTAGIYVSTADGKSTVIASPNVWAIINNHAVFIGGGDVSVLGGVLRNSNQGVTVNNANSRVLVDGVRFKGLTGSPINPAVSTTNITVGKTNQYDDIAAGGNPVSVVTNAPAKSIASAATLLLPATSEQFAVTGITNITSLQGGYAGRTVELQFAGALTVSNGTGSTTSMALSGGNNFSATANSTLSLRHDGTQWYEIGRSGVSAGAFTTLTAGSGSGAADIAVTNTTANGAQIRMVGNGGVTPSKTLRATSGAFSIVNDAYSAQILTLTDSGNLSVPGSTSHTAQEIDASYTYNTPTTGQTVTLATGTETTIIAPAGTLATLTVTLPGCTAGYDGSIARFSSTQSVTALTVNATSGTVVDAPTTLAIGGGAGYLCRGANTSWYRLY